MGLSLFLEGCATMMNPAKLKKLQAKAATGGAGPQRTAGAPRRKRKVVHNSSGSEAKKLQITLKKNGVNPFPSVDEVNMFKEDGHILHFESPKVQASTDANTFAISGNGELKQITELLPGIVNQLGPNNMGMLKQMADTLQNQSPVQAAADDDDDVPDLVDNFEAAAQVD